MQGMLLNETSQDHKVFDSVSLLDLLIVHKKTWLICVLTSSTKCSFIFTTEGSLVDKTDLLALYLSGT